MRLVLVWAPDGINLQVANREQLERSSGVDVGEAGWRDVERWVFDVLEKGEGRQSGRRAQDPAFLIYRRRESPQDATLLDHEEAVRLKLRQVIDEKYPGLPRALEAIRRSLGLGDVPAWELPEHAAPPGWHDQQDANEDREDTVDAEKQWRDLQDRARRAVGRQKL